MPSWVNPDAHPRRPRARDSRRGVGRPTARDHAGPERLVPCGDASEAGFLHSPPDLGPRIRIAGVGSHHQVEGKAYAEWRAGPLLGKDEPWATR